MGVDISQRIQKEAEWAEAPSGEKYRAISLRAINRLAEELGIGRREVEISALEGGIVPLRYHRNIGAIGIDGQLKLRRARIGVVGAGGLGGFVVELLARLGIGSLVIIDGEVFAEENLNRQILVTEENIGEGKAAAAARRVSAVNSSVEVEAHRVFVTRENIDMLLKGCSLAIDALDSIPARLLVQEAAGRLGIPFIHGAVAGFVGEAMTVLPGDSGLISVFGAGNAVPRKGVEVEAGTPTVTPAVVAVLEVMEAVKVVLGRGNTLHDRMIYMDLVESTLSEIRLSGGL